VTAEAAKPERSRLARTAFLIGVLAVVLVLIAWRGNLLVVLGDALVSKRLRSLGLFALALLAVTLLLEVAGLTIGPLALVKTWRRGGPDRRLALVGTVMSIIPFLVFCVIGLVVSGRANEMRAVNTLMCYSLAQQNRHLGTGEAFRNDYRQFFAGTSRPYLGLDPEREKAWIAARGPDGEPEFGYRFLECARVGGKPINWAKDFALCATPANYGETGRRTFVVRADGVVWAKDLGRAEFVEDFPADPGAEGWEKVQ